MASLLVLNFEILRESIKIFCKNGRLISYVTIYISFITSLLYLSDLSSIKVFIMDLLIDRKSFLGIDINIAQLLNLLARKKNILGMFFAVSCFTVLATLAVLASAITYRGKELSFKDLVTTSAKPWVRVFITQLCNSVFDVAFSIIFMFLLVPVTGIQIKAHAVLGVLEFVMYTYIIIIWNLALVVSAMEEICGLTAFKKAFHLIKGLNKEGFVLNLVFLILSFALGKSMKLILEINTTLPVTFVLGLVVVNCVSLVTMLKMMVFIVFYYHCKKTHEESIELQGSIDGNSKIPESASLVDQDFP